MKLLKGDTLELMATLPDGCADMILCDLPYGTTACKWDTAIPFEPLWEQYKRVIKPNGAIVLFGSEPFSSLLRVSALEMFKYDWVWEKSRFANQMLAKVQPLKIHEMVSVFAQNKAAYYPQGLVRCDKVTKQGASVTDNNGGGTRKTEYLQEFTNYPRSIAEFKSEGNTVHSTQKPVALCEYLIRTYTNEGETVLDNTMGSGTTGVACVNTGRHFIGIERDDKYFEIAQNRIIEAMGLA